MRNCVLYCKNPKKLHVFPDENRCPKRRKAWIKLLCVDEESDFRKLFACEKHFSAAMRRGTKLWHRALPDINLPPREETSAPEPEEQNGVLFLPSIFTVPGDEVERLKLLILNTKVPIVLRGFDINWSCFNGTLENWCKKLDAKSSKPLLFERAFKYAPQWERQRTKLQMDALQFLNHHNVEREYWTGLNYKRVQELPDVCTEGIDFSCFGFDSAADDCTFWLSSKGANTPCHYDAYGCNIVTQIYGSKMWLLFPPDAPLTPTRIPYEESSIYCTENFYSPNPATLKNYKKLQRSAYRCILQPNDVLIVPRQWWHYVEALETSLSVNSWIPLQNDVESQLQECIVKFLMDNFVNGASQQVAQYVLNPNEVQQNCNEPDMFGIIDYLLKTLKTDDYSTYSKNLQHLYKYQYLKESDVKILYRYNMIAEEVPLLLDNDFNQQLRANSLRFNPNTRQQDASPMNRLKELLINSICSPNIINSIKTEFNKRVQNDVK